MGEFDRTKKAIGVGGMDDKDRQEMFNKFKSAGGQIVNDKEAVEKDKKEQSKSSASQKQSGGSQKTPKATLVDKKTEFDKKRLEAQQSQKDMEAQMGNFLNRLIVKFKCWAGRVTPFGSPELLPEFLSELNFEGKNALMELKMAALELLGHPALSPKLASQLDKINPIYIELIGRTYKFYEASEFTKIQESYNPNINTTIPIPNIAPEIYTLFRKLYYMYSFQGTYRKGIMMAYDIMQKLENKPTIIYTNKKKKLAYSITIVFDRLFQKLYLAILRNENKNIPMISYFMEDLLGIIDDERPGKRQGGEPLPIGNQANIEEKTEEQEEEAVEEEPSDEEFISNLSSELRMGLHLMGQLSLDMLKSKYDSKNEFGILPANDKAFLTYLFFRELDYEYSFVLTTKKINYKITNDKNNVKVDNRQRLLDTYELSRSCMDQFRIYKDVYEELKKNKENPSINYIDASKKISQNEQKRVQQSRNVRVSIKDFAENAKEILGVIVQDMKAAKTIVGNPEELMVFDSIESKKRMHRKPIKQCIYEAYCYSLALYERINNGDLTGGTVELTPEEVSKAFDTQVPITEDEKNMDANSISPSPSTIANPKNKSAENEKSLDDQLNSF